MDYMDDDGSEYLGGYMGELAASPINSVGPLATGYVMPTNQGPATGGSPGAGAASWINNITGALANTANQVLAIRAGVNNRPLPGVQGGVPQSGSNWGKIGLGLLVLGGGIYLLTRKRK